MSERVDLIWLGDSAPPQWTLGEVFKAAPSSASIHQLVEAKLPASATDAWLFWDGQLGVPDAEVVKQTLDLPGHVWHAGLSLGMSGLPCVIDFVEPTWTFNRDPSADHMATSWRLSLRACLIRTDILRQMGGVDPRFQTLEAAALDIGHRYITQGVFTRYVPSLISRLDPKPSPASIPLKDELRFLMNRFKRWQRWWALFRMIASKYASPIAALDAWRCAGSNAHYRTSRLYRAIEMQAGVDSEENPVSDVRVSVIIPTLNRYLYLRALLRQLREQTVPPAEIIIIDQTEPHDRDLTLEQEFGDLPLRIIYQDQPGQCSSRNRGLQMSSGEYILFVDDDDDEVTPTFIEAHLGKLRQFGSEVSSGVAYELGAGALPDNFTFTRLSDVFPTNNSMIRREVLRHSGLFDLAYDRGQRADGDLGMRIYLSGALMILHPEISVLHHHAPSGGLRAHKARKITYASSRQRIFQRHLPSVSEIYLVRRYFTPRQLREALWLRVFGTFRVRGSRLRKAAKMLVAFFLLPDTCWRIVRRSRRAAAMLERFPQIATLPADEMANVSHSQVTQP